MEADQSAIKVTRQTTRTEPNAQNTPLKPVLIMLSGLPGTGKSYICRKLAERLPYIVVESDALRKELFPRPSYSTRESASLFRAIHYQIKDILQKGLSVIFDATNLEERHRKIVYRIAGRAGARLILVEVEAPPLTVKKRLKDRLKQRESDNYSDATWEVYQRMKKSANKIRLSHFTVDTASDITPVIKEIVKEADR
jgi:predicted kinase